MFTLPPEFAIFVVAFEPLFSNSIWPQAQVLFIGAILATGKRTVTAALRIMGLSTDEHFQNYHRVLDRAVWYYSGEPALPIRWVFKHRVRRATCKKSPKFYCNAWPRRFVILFDKELFG